MNPILQRLALSILAGTILSASLVALDQTAVAATAADPAESVRAGQLLALAGWLGGWSRFVPFRASRPRQFGLLASSGTNLAAVTGVAATTVLVALASSPHSAARWLSAAGVAVIDGLLFSILAACLLETTRTPRALVVWFLVLGWIVPALMGGALASIGGATSNPRVPTSALGELFLPVAIAFAALMGALWAARPRFGAE